MRPLLSMFTRWHPAVRPILVHLCVVRLFSLSQQCPSCCRIRIYPLCLPGLSHPSSHAHASHPSYYHSSSSLYPPWFHQSIRHLALQVQIPHPAPRALAPPPPGIQTTHFFKSPLHPPRLLPTTFYAHVRPSIRPQPCTDAAQLGRAR
jgi:hypothetical protein